MSGSRGCIHCAAPQSAPDEEPNFEAVLDHAFGQIISPDNMLPTLSEQRAWLLKEHELAISRQVTAQQALPMGVSAWITHGKRYGYFDFAMKQEVTAQLEAFAEELKREMRENLDYTVSMGEIDSFLADLRGGRGSMNSTNQAREELIKEFSVALSEWLDEFKELQPWEQEGDVSEEKWAEYGPPCGSCLSALKPNG